METKLFETGTEDVGTRADVFISSRCGLTRSAASRLLEENRVEIGSKTILKNYKIRSGDVLKVTFPDARPCEVEPEDIPLDVVFEDDDVIVVNKPAGMVVHPAPGHETGTLVSALLWHCRDSLSGVGGVERQGIVHRIDRDTTGLIAAAKNDRAHLALASQLSDHTMHREYYAIVVGALPGDKGTVDKPIARHPSDRKKMAVVPSSAKNARNAVTHYEVISSASGFTFAKMILETGRTHQIRVHMASIGHPVLGDPVYGGDRTLFQKHHPSLFKGQMLHAAKLVFNHPSTGERTEVTCPLPDNFRRALELIGIDPDIT